MALYVSKARRRRNAVVAVIAAAVLAFVLGLLIGRQQVPSVDTRVRQVQDDASSIATGLERLDIEYDQVLTGSDDLQSSVLTPLDDLRTDLQRAMDRAPWLTGAQRSAVLDDLAAVEASATGQATSEEFTAALDHAAALVRETFAVTG